MRQPALEKLAAFQFSAKPVGIGAGLGAAAGAATAFIKNRKVNQHNAGLESNDPTRKAKSSYVKHIGIGTGLGAAGGLASSVRKAKPTSAPSSKPEPVFNKYHAAAEENRKAHKEGKISNEQFAQKASSIGKKSADSTSEYLKRNSNREGPATPSPRKSQQQYDAERKATRKADAKAFKARQKERRKSDDKWERRILRKSRFTQMKDKVVRGIRGY